MDGRTHTPLPFPPAEPWPTELFSSFGLRDLEQMRHDLDAEIARRKNAADVNERFWSKVDKTGDCWIWGANKRGGYGLFSVSRRKVSAHRYAYELLVGPIPAGLDLDHLCRNTACVNPSHLEPVTHAENVRRGAAAVRGPECGKGHPFTPENTYTEPSGARQCKTCNREREQAKRAALRDAGLTTRGTQPVRLRAWDKSLTTCKYGHELTEENTYVNKSGGRRCRTCHREYQNARYHRNKTNDGGRRPDLGESVSRRPQEVTVMDECTCGGRGICARCAMHEIESEYDRDPFAQALEQAVDIVTRPANVVALPGYSRRVS